MVEEDGPVVYMCSPCGVYSSEMEVEMTPKIREGWGNIDISELVCTDHMLCRRNHAAPDFLRSCYHRSMDLANYQQVYFDMLAQLFVALRSLVLLFVTFAF